MPVAGSWAECLAGHVGVLGQPLPGGGLELTQRDDTSSCAVRAGTGVCIRPGVQGAWSFETPKGGQSRAGIGPGGQSTIGDDREVGSDQSQGVG